MTEPTAADSTPERTPLEPAGALSHQKIKADIVVVGGGSGGLSVAAGAAMLGLKVVLFEQGEMGGDCLNTGCVPSKALLTAAKKAQVFRDAATWGLTPADPGVRWDAVKAHVKGVIETIAPVDSQERFEGLGVTVIREHAKFIDKNTIGSASATVKAKRIVIATGSRAFIPPIPGLDTVSYITNEEIFDLPTLPDHLVILGGGPIGIEMAQAFRRFGSKVTIIEMGRALARADADHAAKALEKLRGEGIDILEGHKAVQVSDNAAGVTVTAETDSGSKQITGSHLLVAVGREAILGGIGLEEGGVEYDRRGIKTKDNLRSSSNPKVWAVGDVAGREQFTHMAGWHASVFVQAALMKLRTKANTHPVPAVTYIEPEVAQVGLTEAEAREQFGDQVKVSEFAFDENDRAIAERHDAGSAKLIVGKGDKILGASIYGDGAGDILQIVSLAMSNGLKMRALTNFISPYPTRAEVVKRAASKYFQPKVFGPAMKTAVSLLQRIP